MAGKDQIIPVGDAGDVNWLVEAQNGEVRWLGTVCLVGAMHRAAAMYRVGAVYPDRGVTYFYAG